MNFSDFINECNSLNKEKEELLSSIKANEQKRLEKLYMLTQLVEDEFDKYDINKDGFIDFYEYLVYTVSSIKKGKSFDENGEDLIKKFYERDQNNDKLISKKEILDEQIIKFKLKDLLCD